MASTVEEVLALFRSAGNARGTATALWTLGITLPDLGDHVRGTAREEDAMAPFRELDDRSSVARWLNRRGLTAYDVGDYDRATTLLEVSMLLRRSVGYWHAVALDLNNLA